MDNMESAQLSLDALIKECDNIPDTDKSSYIPVTVVFPWVKYGDVCNTDCDCCHLTIVCIHRSQRFPKRFADPV